MWCILRLDGDGVGTAEAGRKRLVYESVGLDGLLRDGCDGSLEDIPLLPR
jgi:hypothetical protein